jgi:hypothetical protein
LRHRTLKIGLVAATLVGAALRIGVGTAYADYSPNPGDVVGVGSDTLQYMLDFLADGDAYGHLGYNTTLHNKYKLVNIDATADANARLAYGVDGGQTGQGTCTPGTGSTSGTGNATTTNAGIPCVLNPTVVLRAGTQPVQRPNGSGAGVKALVQDIEAGHNLPATEVINYARASAVQEQTCAGSSCTYTGPTMPTGEHLDQLTVATDTLPILAAKTTHAVALSASQLGLIYSQNTGNCITWSNPQISGVYMQSAVVTNSSASVTFTPPTGDSNVPTAAANNGWVVQGAGITTGTTVSNVTDNSGTYTVTLSANATATNTESVGLVNPNASTDTITPIIPQVGSGTRSFFLGQIGVASNAVGTCTSVAEENDPTAINDVTIGTSLSPEDSIEPISQGRLDLYEGINEAGTAGGIGGYFLDPSCAYLVGTSPTCGTGSISDGTDTYVPNSVSVSSVATLTGSPVGLGAYTSPTLANGRFDVTRTLYLYFRNTDLTSTAGWQPGSKINWVRTLFYNPCPVGATNCVTSNGNEYGPGGPPYIQTSAGQTLLEDAGVLSLATETCTEIDIQAGC